jgi:hypothetical protein
MEESSHTPAQGVTFSKGFKGPQSKEKSKENSVFVEGESL